MKKIPIWALSYFCLKYHYCHQRSIRVCILFASQFISDNSRFYLLSCSQMTILKNFMWFPIHQWYLLYSWFSLSRTRLSRITAYLEVKIWSLPKHENLTTGKKYCGTEEKLLLRSNFSSFPQYFKYISNFKNLITYIFVKCVNRLIFFFNSANLICQGTDISKYFRESLGIRDIESQLYFICFAVNQWQ